MTPKSDAIIYNRYPLLYSNDIGYVCKKIEVNLNEKHFKITDDMLSLSKIRCNSFIDYRNQRLTNTYSDMNFEQMKNKRADMKIVPDTFSTESRFTQKQVNCQRTCASNVGKRYETNNRKTINLFTLPAIQPRNSDIEKSTIKFTSDCFLSKYEHISSQWAE